MTLARSFVLASVVVAAAACGKQDAAPAPTAAPDRVQIEVVQTGFRPAEVTVGKDHPTTLVFTRRTDATCAKEVEIPIARPTSRAHAPYRDRDLDLLGAGGVGAPGEDERGRVVLADGDLGRAEAGLDHLDLDAIGRGGGRRRGVLLAARGGGGDDGGEDERAGEGHGVGSWRSGLRGGSGVGADSGGGVSGSPRPFQTAKTAG